MKEKDWLNMGLLYLLFSSLRRESGLALDLRQYELLLSALRQGIGSDEDGKYSKPRFLSLCKTLWLMHPRDEAAFNRVFENIIDKLESAWEYLREEPAVEAEKTPEEGLQDSIPLPREPVVRSDDVSKMPLPEVKELDVPEPKPEEQSNQPKREELPTSVQDEAVYRKWELSFEALSDTISSDEFSQVEPAPHSFVYADHYLPFVPRRLQQQCRHLRYRAEKRLSDTLDAASSIQATAQTAGFPQLRYGAERHFVGRFIIFVDRGRSMTAFDKLADTFAQTLAAALGMGAHLPNFKVYYFNEVPYQLIFMDSSLAVSKPWEEVQRLLTKDDRIFILSDAGAANWRRDKERNNRTLEWMQEIRQKTRHVLWLNPVPRERWAGTAAFYLPLLTHCLPMTKASLQRLPYVLKHI